MAKAAAGDDLVALVRSGDYDRFLAIQLAPSDKRAALYAVVAFHIEVASVAEQVSEPLIGHIRYAWWREALQEIEAGKPPRNHPVVLALAQVPRSVFPYLYEMIDARAADLDASLIAEEAAWLAYCEATAGALHLALATLIDAPYAKTYEAQIRAQGKAYAMIGLVRAIPFMAAQGWQRFPESWMAAAGISSLAPSEALNDFVRQIIARAIQIMTDSSNNPKLKAIDALRALATHSTRALQSVSHDPYRLRPAKLPSVWQVVKIHYL